MRNKNELRRYVFFQLNECKMIEEYLEKMALKGWKLKYINMFFCFEKIEPQELFYSVNIYPKPSIYDTPPTISESEYMEYCQQAGWDYVCSLEQANIFVTQSKDAIPIETDEQMKFKTIKREVLKQNAIIFFLYFPFFIYKMGSMFLDFESLVTENGELMIFFSNLIIFATLIIQNIWLMLWIRNQERRIKEHEPVQYISTKGHKKTRLLFGIALTIILIMSLLIMYHSMFQKDYYTVLMISYGLSIAPIALLYSYFFQKQKAGKNSRIKIFLLTTIGLGMIATTISTTFNLLPVTYLNEGVIRYSSKSFLASCTVYGYTFEDGKWGTVKVLESDVPYVINQYFKSGTQWTPRTNYMEVDVPEWNARAVFIHADYYHYIKYDTTVIWFNHDGPTSVNDIEQIKMFID